MSKYLEFMANFESFECDWALITKHKALKCTAYIHWNKTVLKLGWAVFSVLRSNRTDIALSLLHNLVVQGYLKLISSSGNSALRWSICVNNLFSSEFMMRIAYLINQYLGLATASFGENHWRWSLQDSSRKVFNPFLQHWAGWQKRTN